MGTRYDMGVISARVEQRRIARGVPPKQAASVIGLEKWDWSRKTHNKGSAFTIGELARLADAFEAPTGWPFIDEKIGSAVDNFFKAAAPQSPPEPAPPPTGEPEPSRPSPASQPSAGHERRGRRGGHI